MKVVLPILFLLIASGIYFFNKMDWVDLPKNFITDEEFLTPFYEKEWELHPIRRNIDTETWEFEVKTPFQNGKDYYIFLNPRLNLEKWKFDNKCVEQCKFERIGYIQKVITSFNNSSQAVSIRVENQ